MPGPKRADEAYCLYHALNRGNAKSDIFKKDANFHAFERILGEGLERYPCQIWSIVPSSGVLKLRVCGHPTPKRK
jgi:putative transposase